MQNQSNFHNIVFQEEKEKRKLQEDIQPFDGEYIAKIFKFYRRQQNPYVSHTLPLKLVSGKTLYKKHKAAFDKFAEIAMKNNFDVDRYIKYCIKCGINEDVVETCLTSTTMIDKYIEYVKRFEKRKKIYAWFIKSAKNIALECINEGYFTTKDLLKDLIQNKKISSYIASGYISIYFFAAIPNFNKVIPKLDYFSQLELDQLKNHFDVYHSEVNKAFMQVKNCMVNPIDFTDKLICKLREKKIKIIHFTNSKMI